MAHTVIMPKLGQTVEESTVLKWHKKIGDQVKKGEVLFEIETDKAVLEVESFADGKLLKILVKDGETVPVMTPVAFIGQPGEPVPEVPALVREPASPLRRTKPSALPAPFSVRPLRPPAPIPSAPSPAAPALPAKRLISPRARQAALEHAISYEPITGTGAAGRITEKDVLNYLELKKYKKKRITPAAKALAVKEGIDILTVETDEPERRISVEDIKRKIAEKPKEMTRIRQIIAQRLAKSFSSTPHFYVTAAIDMTDLLEFRKKLQEENKLYSITDFILKACAIALTEFPAVNSTTDGKSVRWHAKVHLGLAVDIKEGLVVPVIRNADTISFSELHEQVMTLVAKARNGKLSPDEMTLSTFTVSNMGMLNVENFTAIINPGESALLAVASILPTPTVVKDQVLIRSVMKATLSCDHRILDGAIASHFINRIKNLLEDMTLWTSMT